MASFFGKIFFFCLNTKLGGIKNCPKKKFCKLDNFVIFENIDENVPSSSLCISRIKELEAPALLGRLKICMNFFALEVVYNKISNISWYTYYHLWANIWWMLNDDPEIMYCGHTNPKEYVDWNRVCSTCICFS